MYPYKGRRGRWRLDYRREGNVATEAEIGMVCPQAKRCQKPQEAEEEREKPEPSAGVYPADTLISAQ